MTRINIKNLLTKTCLVILSITMAACGSDDNDGKEKDRANQKTLFMYMPWSSNLTSDFKRNISDMEESISKNGLHDNRVVVFLATSPAKAEMFEITYKDGRCGRNTLKEYDNPKCTTAEGIASILHDVKAFAPALTYSMTIGCHGMAWLPVKPSKGRTAKTASQASEETLSPQPHNKMYWDYDSPYRTRYFGGTSAEYQTDISTLAEGIDKAGMKMEYILFDDCYMSSVEVAYELKDVADYLIASTCEIMAYGMPYGLIGKYLLGKTDYQSVCDGFYSFYSSYEPPCGTLAVTCCRELDKLAAVMREINSRFDYDTSMNGSLQCLDGYSPTLFFDYGDYVEHLCTDPALLQAFKTQLNNTVRHKTHTGSFYSMMAGRPTPIHTFSGLTISDPSVNGLADDKTSTAWYKATH